MNILLSQQSNKAIYEQIAEQIKNAILKKDIKSDEALPSIRKLAKELKVSVITIKKAYECLDNQGLIYTRAGKGCFVSNYDYDKIKLDAKLKIKESIKSLYKQSLESGMSKKEWIKLCAEVSEEEL